MNTVNWTKKAFKQARKLGHQARVQVVKDAGSLKDFPNVAGVKALTNHQYAYRLRSGDYRIFFEYDGEIKIVTIEEVKKRDERTY